MRTKKKNPTDQHTPDCFISQYVLCKLNCVIKTHNPEKGELSHQNSTSGSKKFDGYWKGIWGMAEKFIS